MKAITKFFILALAMMLVSGILAYQIGSTLLFAWVYIHTVLLIRAYIIFKTRLAYFLRVREINLAKIKAGDNSFKGFDEFSYFRMLFSLRWSWDVDDKGNII